MTTDQLPQMALSIRQPWAWAILNAGKDIENRGFKASKALFRPGLRVAIHASKAMTEEEYRDGAEAIFRMSGQSAKVPAPGHLSRGAIVGAVTMVDRVEHSSSPWFTGLAGIVLANPEILPSPIYCNGQLTLFDWRSQDLRDKPEPPLKWMVRPEYAFGWPKTAF